MSSPFVPIITAELDWCQDLPVSIQFDDIYYSMGNGINQGRYVFIEGNRLVPRWQELPHDNDSVFTIAETGFGTGLNFLLTWQLWEQHAPQAASLHFISCEKHPLKLADLQRCLTMWPEIANQAAELIKQYPVLTPGYHHLSFANGRVTLTLMLGDALDCFEQLLHCGDARLETELRSHFVDAWYLDGFAPAKNKSMWSDALMSVIAMLSNEHSTLATYTAASSVKSSLQKVGFVVEKKKGFGPKRHMICGQYKRAEGLRIKHRQTPWHSAGAQKNTEKSALIVGAGLAGCYTAYSLARRGWKTTLIDGADQAGSCGSANAQAVLFPQLSAHRSPLTQFMLTAFLYAAKVYPQLITDKNMGDLHGSLLLAHNAQEAKIQDGLQSWLANYPELGRLVDVCEASELAGIELMQNGLFIPLSGWINSPKLCELLIHKSESTLITNSPVSELNFDGAHWHINGVSAPVLILANGNQVNAFKETKYMPLKTIRGQMSAIKSTVRSAALKIPICAAGHVVPAHNGVHNFGASYELGVLEPVIKSADNEANLHKLQQIGPQELWSEEIIGQWVGIRASTPDYLPLVGQVAIADEFIKLFAKLETNSKRWIAASGAYYPGLYACAGFGSRGLTTIPLCAEWLAAMINNEMGFLPRSFVQSFSTARFLRKDIIRGLYSL